MCPRSSLGNESFNRPCRVGRVRSVGSDRSGRVGLVGSARSGWVFQVGSVEWGRVSQDGSVGSGRVGRVIDVHAPHENEEIIHASKIIPQERIIQKTVEPVLEVPVAMTREEIVHVPTVVNHNRHHHVEQ